MPLTLINLFQKIRYLLALGRINMAPITISAPVIGALTSHKVGFSEVVLLGLIGLFAHLFGFIINDLWDFELDRTVSYRQKNPLNTGVIKPIEAWFFVFLQFTFALVLYILLKGKIEGILSLITSVCSSLIYNRWSKWGRIAKWIPETCLALSIGTLALSGALLSGQHLEWPSILFCLELALGLLLLNSVPSGLKDIKTDIEFGAHSFVIWMGVKINNGGILLPRNVWVYCFTLQALYFSGLLSLSWLFGSSWWAITTAIILSIFAILHLRMILSLNNFNYMTQASPLLSGAYNYFALLILLHKMAPLAVSVFISGIVIFLLSMPISLGYKMWRKRYGLIISTR